MIMGQLLILTHYHVLYDRQSFMFDVFFKVSFKKHIVYFPKVDIFQANVENDFCLVLKYAVFYAEFEFKVNFT